LLKEVFERTPAFNERVAGARFRSYEWQFLAALDGKTTAGDILRRLDVDEASIADFVAQQLQSGAIAPRLLSFDEFLGSKSAKTPQSSGVDDFRSIVRSTIVAAVAELIVMIGKRRSQPPAAPQPRPQYQPPPYQPPAQSQTAYEPQASAAAAPVEAAPAPLPEPVAEVSYYAAEPPQEYTKIVEELESTSWVERATPEPPPAAASHAEEPAQVSYYVAPEPVVEPQAYEPQPSYEPQPAYEAQPAYESQPAYEPQAAHEPEAAYKPEPAYESHVTESAPADDMTISARLMRDYGPLSFEEAQAAGFTGAALSDYALHVENHAASPPSSYHNDHEPEATESPDAVTPLEAVAETNGEANDPIVFSLSARNPDSFWSGKK
jgi:hypothetical protein